MIRCLAGKAAGMARTSAWIPLLLIAAAAVPAAGQSSRPAPPPPVREVVIDDPDAFLEQPSSDAQPPAGAADDGEAVNPFAGTRPWSRPDSRAGVVELSDGRTLAGYVFTTRGRGWRLYDPAARKYRDIPTIIVRRIEAVVLWERMEDQWRFARMGDDEKVFTGHKYPNRMLEYRFTLVNGRTLQGAIAQPLNVEWRNEREALILHKRQKGDLDQPLADLPYVRLIEFSAERMNAARAQQPASRPAAKE
jgi:hypothetical protein